MSDKNGAVVDQAAELQDMAFDDVVDAKCTGVQYEQHTAWGRRVGLLSVMAGEVLEWLEQKDNPERKKEAGLLLLARSMVDRNRKRLTDYDPVKEQLMVDALKLKDSKTVNFLTDRVLIMNGIRAETAVQAKNDSAASS